MDWLIDFFTWVGEWFSAVKEFFYYLPEIISDALVALASWLTLIWVKIQISTLEFAYAVAQEVLADFDAYAVVSSAFNSLPDGVRALAHAYGIPNCIRIVMDAFATKFVLRLMGW